MTSPITTEPGAPLAPLSTTLRVRTRAEHERAESRPFIAALMNGELHTGAYIDLAVQHAAIYRALEAGGHGLRTDPRLGALVRPELLRTERVEADLTDLVGPDWRERTSLTEATRRYVDRLDEVAATPTGYLAHAYTRYLGDLSGGQVVRTMLRRHYGLAPEVLRFYDFEVDKPKPYKDGYREAMDQVTLSSEEYAAVVDEATVAFDLNSAVFADLGLRHLAA
ncbi:heme oxygenase (biliverdin-producing) [Naumannella halotolerans]|uniref:Heme oxygenase n=1 Tax=Naumannella halotolerans TaxID=993414 RepID=A0A4R7JCA8_9ACTN|nr:biliverdin-producing heme oxygenase [Naumannella halotolerans]TDT34089.1 heme oxygenase [Naumannella halotolerans]